MITSLRIKEIFLSMVWMMFQPKLFRQWSSACCWREIVNGYYGGPIQTKRDAARTAVPTWCSNFELKRLISTSNSGLLSKQGKLIIVEGNIAAGKSVLSKRLGEHFHFVVHDEPAPKNPYLAKFYKEPKKYALKLQLWLFQQRYLMYLQGLKHIILTGQGVVLDRSIYSDLVFTNVIFQDGHISRDGYQYYLKVRSKAMESIPAPYAVIYLNVSSEVCFKRIVKRGRVYEQQIPMMYLDKLNREHENVFHNLSKGEECPVLNYDWSNFGFDPEKEKRLPNSNSSSPLYISGFEKIIEDIENLKRMWIPQIPERLQGFDKDPDILKNELVVEGYDHISHEIPNE